MRKTERKTERKVAVSYIILRLYSLITLFFFPLEISGPLQELLPKYI